MNLWHKFISRARVLFSKRSLEADMAEEMRQHIELRIESNLAAGMSPEEARYDAARQFGHADGLKEAARDARGWRWFENFCQDTRYGLRTMIKRPGFTTAAVLTLALGIGFVTTIFTVLNGIAFAELPFEDSNRIVGVAVSSSEFDEIARRQTSCETFALAQNQTVNLRVDGAVSRHSASVVSANFLDVLRARTSSGRGFLLSDEAPAAGKAVLIGETLWRDELRSDPAVLGREIHVNGEVRTIVGVMPAWFGFPRNATLWMPRVATETLAGAQVFGRLKAGVSASRASAEFTALLAQLTPEVANQGAPRPRVEVEPFARQGVKDAIRIVLMAILGATLLVLLLACANVTNLVLARACERSRELAIRCAVGATRGRLIVQMLTESLVLAMAGAAGGAAIAWFSTKWLWDYIAPEAALTGGIPFWVNFNFDGRVLACVAVATVIATLLTGLTPALQASRIELSDAVKQGGGGTGLRLTRLTRILINAQMALSVCLVIGAGLFLTVLLAFNQKELPYNPAAVLTARISLDDARYADAAARQTVFAEIISRLGALPGVEAAGLTSSESLRPAQPRIEIEGHTYASNGQKPSVAAETISPGYFDVLGVRVREGRNFTTEDRASSQPVAIVNAAFAGRFGPDGVVGKRFRLASANAGNAWITIIGVAPELGSMKAGSASAGALFYRPVAQQAERAMTVLVRGSGDVTRLTPAIRQAVATIDADLPVFKIQTVQAIIELERIGMNVPGALFVICGVGALILATVGVYGVISFSVRMRTRELGVRLALGASPSAIVKLIVRQGLLQISLGLGMGVVLALGLSAALSSTFEGLGSSPYSVWIYLSVVALLGLVGVAALLIPALRGSRVDPMVALRAE